MNVILWDNESVWCNDWPYNKYGIGHCDIYFMVQRFCLISWSLLDCWMSYIRLMSRCDAMIDLIIDVGHSELYLIGQWFGSLKSSDVCLLVCLCTQIILVFLAKHSSGELCCPATALILWCSWIWFSFWINWDYFTFGIVSALEVARYTFKYA